MADAFSNFTAGLESPATCIHEITPNDSVDLETTSRAINVGQNGTVRVTTIEDTTATLFIAAGVPFPVRAKRIWATGTTATNIVALS